MLSTWFPGSTTGKRQSSSRRFVPRLEVLEGRALLSTFTVLNLSDSGAGSLRQAIFDANVTPGPDTIDFADGLHGTIPLTSGQLIIIDDVTINGPGADKLTVSGTHSQRVFAVLGGIDASSAIAVSISDLTIANGRSAFSAGGILNTGFSDATLTRVVLSGNEVVASVVSDSSPNGGAIRNSAPASMSLIDSLVVGNVARPATMGLLQSFGGGISNSGRLLVANSTITGNRVIASPGGSAVGGGIHTAGTAGTVTVVNSTIAHNEAVGGRIAFGGGISNSSSLSITDSFISQNRVRSETAIGGGIGADGDTVVVNSTIAGNKALGDGGLGGSASGGGIQNEFGSLSITDSRITDNRAVGGNGGTNIGNDFSFASAFGGGIANYLGQIEVVRSTLGGNQAIGGDTATHHAPNTADVGGGHGGAIYNSLGAEAVIRDSTIAHNRAVGGHGNTGSGPVAVVGTATGGGIDNSLDASPFGFPGAPGAPRVTVLNSVIRQNDAVGGDDNTASGAVLFVGAGLGGGIANYLGATADISGSSLGHNRAIGGEGNTAAGGSVPASLGAGGAVFNALGGFNLDTGDVLAPSLVNVINSTLEHNQARGGRDSAGNGGDGWGGAIASLFDADTNVSGSFLENNHAIGGNGGDASDGGNGLGGGAFNDDTSSLALASSIITRNHATGGDGGQEGEGIGGGVYNLGLFDLDMLSWIFDNHASTGDDDIFDIFA